MHRRLRWMVAMLAMVALGAWSACGGDEDDGGGFEVDTGYDAGDASDSGGAADSGGTSDTGSGTDTGSNTDTGSTSDTGSAAWASCSANSDCVLRANSCCGVCGQPTLGDVDAVNAQQTEAHFDAVCPEPEPCPECPEAPNPWLVASCQFGTCAAFDMAQEPATACQTDADCKIRTTDCCECGGDSSRGGIIAINAAREGMFADLVCDNGQICGACQPIYPDEASAVCGTSGHCEIVWP